MTDPATLSVALEPGEFIGEYRIERKLGESGGGAVYEAVHPLIGKRVAILPRCARGSRRRAAVEAHAGGG